VAIVTSRHVRGRAAAAAAAATTAVAAAAATTTAAADTAAAAPAAAAAATTATADTATAAAVADWLCGHVLCRGCLPHARLVACCELDVTSWIVKAELHAQGVPQGEGTDRSGMRNASRDDVMAVAAGVRGTSVGS
jgi:nucleoid-associated protein YgaU